MTHIPDAARHRGVAARWCALAEQRLQHLTELFDSGRWRRYYSERAFVENIREATAVVAFWRDLAGLGPAKNNAAIDIAARIQPRSALTQSQSTLAETRRLPLHNPRSLADPVREPSLPAVQERVSAPQSRPAKAAVEPTLEDRAIIDRYPILRNGL